MASHKSIDRVVVSTAICLCKGRLVILICTMLFLVTVVGCKTIAQTYVPESPHWFLGGLPAPGSASLQTLTDSIIPDNSEWLPGYYGYDPNGVWRIDTVGIWHGRTVIDMFYEVQCPRWKNPSEFYTHIAIKAIAVSTSSLEFRLLYQLESEPGVWTFEPSRLVQIDRTLILYTDSRQSGTGNFHHEEYWTWDETESVPRRLNIKRVMGRAFARVLPEGHGIWHGGGFIIDSLSFEKYTHRDGDGNCCPTGGTVRVKLKLSENRIVVDSAVFDYAAVEPRALWSAERSEDSLYLKNPPRVYYGEQGFTITDIPEWLHYNAYSRVYSITRPASILDTLVNRDVWRIISPSIYGRTPPTFRWQVDTLGLVHRRPVVRIAYSFDCKACNGTSGKVIAIELEPSHFRPIYIELAPAGGAAAGDTIIRVQGETLINVKKTGRYPGEIGDQYWIWPDEEVIPVALYREWVLRETLAHVASINLPEGLSVRRDNGVWDFKTLAYETYTWRDSDPDDKPGGGKLWIQFGIRDQRLVLTGFNFDPDDTLNTDKDIR